MSQRLEHTQNPIHISREYDPTLPGLFQRLPHPPSKIIVLRASRIGDFINCFPALQALKTHLPTSQLTVITLPMLFDIAKRCQFIDQVEPFPGYPGMADQLFDARRALSFFSQIQSKSYDLAIQMQGSGVYSNPFILMLGAKFNAGFIRSGDAPGRLDAALPLPESGYEVDRMLALTTFLGAPPAGRIPRLLTGPADRTKSDALLSGKPPPYIGLHASARDLTRRWSLDRYTETVWRLQNQHGGTIVVLGEERDRNTVGSAMQKNDIEHLNLAGQTSLDELVSVIHRLSILITNDSGPAHIAYALGTPSVVIFGSGDPTRNGPVSSGPFKILAYPVPCRPCEYVECPIGTICLENIQIEEVVNASEKLLETSFQPNQ
jgi:ADP-heptose:LPS heptosyltransferase